METLLKIVIEQVKVVYLDLIPLELRILLLMIIYLMEMLQHMEDLYTVLIANGL